MNDTKLSWIDDDLELLKSQGFYKTFRVVETPNEAEIIVDGKKVLNFCSNNYLGFANNSKIKKAAVLALETFGVGAGAVRTISGTNKLHQELETKIASFKKTEDAILFQSGFTANLATIPVLVSENDVIFSDELNHASIIDGCRLSKATVIRYKHADPKDLEKVILENPDFSKKLIITDGVFSMDGDIAPLKDIYEVAQKTGCMLMVDDSHGEGVLGENGRGIADHFGLHGMVDVEMGTLSKALGVVGGFIAGKKNIIDLLRQKGRPFLFSTSLTPADTAAASEAISILESSDEAVKKLWDNAKYFQEKLRDLGFDLGVTQTPITPVILKDAKLTQEFSKKLFEMGILATAIIYPTVAKDGARIRVMTSAFHEKKHLDEAIAAFAKIGTEMGVISK
jgi:glycine C-acetyltransferase